jgi:ABC-type transporter Mla subunit MlaD
MSSGRLWLAFASLVLGVGAMVTWLGQGGAPGTLWYWVEARSTALGAVRDGDRIRVEAA